MDVYVIHVWVVDELVETHVLATLEEAEPYAQTRTENWGHSAYANIHKHTVQLPK